MSYPHDLLGTISDGPTREEERLARLAELDLAAAEKAHAKLVAAEDTSDIAELARTYQRMARSLRQTLALKARLTREREAAEAGRPRRPEPVEPHADLKLWNHGKHGKHGRCRTSPTLARHGAFRVFRG